MPRVSEDPLRKSIRYAKGVGEKLAGVLSKKQIRVIEDALWFLPRTYEDRRQIFQVHQLPDYGNVCVVGRVLRAHPVSYTRSRQKFFDLWVEDIERPANLLQLRWFRRPYVLEKLKPGVIVLLRGDIQRYQAQKQIAHPEIEVIGMEDPSEMKPQGIVPVYSQSEGLYQKTLRKIMRNILRDYASDIAEILPQALVDQYSFLSRRKALEEIHFPDSQASFEDLICVRSPAQRRMIYEEFFMFQLGLHFFSSFRHKEKGISFKRPLKSWEKLKEALGFRFTEAQRRALKEILEDMQSPERMHRLLQGDVGSGKTAVAAASALVALESGYQVAMMAPTEVLAEQHFLKFREWLKEMDFEVVKITGSLKTSEKRETLKKAKEDVARIFVGTHALFENPVEFARLGLVVIDEQHRFGVKQRARLSEKAKSPDLLVMSATPIPRSLALSLYGDLDLSTIDELPPGRKPIQTRIFRQSQRQAYVQEVRAQLKEGRQAYMVYPLIDQSEALSLQSIQQELPQLKQDFEGYEVVALHGRMEADEKRRVLERFRKGQVSILVSTTVIEVGVDVPNASVMIVQHAERFGLSQLHQLRGRVGRGAAESFCFLVASHLGSAEIIQRLKALEKTNDGFKIAEIDLEMRGPGELMGWRQSGVPGFRLASLPRDIEILKLARRDARELLRKDPDLHQEPALKARLEAQSQQAEIS